jgi:Fe-S oxidoreductase
LERYGNPLGLPQTERDKFLQKNELPVFDGTQEYLLWLGCMGSYDPQGRDVVVALVRILRHLNLTFGVLKKEKCTGDSARRLGNDLAFQQLAEYNLENIKAVNPSKMLSICPHCVRTMNTDWREFGAELSVEHHSTFLARVGSQLPNAPTQESVVYHDPCYLGRYLNTYDEPRAVIAQSATVVEAPKNRERSFCCGAGGGLAFLGEEEGTRINETRAKELVDTGAGTIGVACPFCSTMFRDAIKTVSPDAPPKLLDIAQIAAARIMEP